MRLLISNCVPKMNWTCKTYMDSAASVYLQYIMFSVVPITEETESTKTEEKKLTKKQKKRLKKKQLRNLIPQDCMDYR